jgi:hypothetical protein
LLLLERNPEAVTPAGNDVDTEVPVADVLF